MSPSAASMIHCTDESPKAALAREGVAGEEFSIFGGKPKVILEKKDSMQNERQISVDPISVRESADLPTLSVPLHHLLLPPAASGKFVSCSLPSSASSSPRFELTSAKQKKKYKNPQPSNLSRQHSVALGNLERLRENRMQRSKSCGEGRACQPSADFDVWSSSGSGYQQRYNESEVKAERREEVKPRLQKKGGDEADDKFKCGACLFLPGLGKGKTVRARKEVEHIDIASQRASLEKFECVSWRSSAMINYEDDGDGDATSNLFFDLPLELMGCSSASDTDSPVTTGFVFDNKDHHHRKGVLKSTTAAAAAHESCNSSRHVRFSTSSPSSPCITPRLRKARDEFSAFLEAQSA